MDDSSLLIVRGHEVGLLLEHRELELIDTVRRAYEAQATGKSSLPHSTFLHFPDSPRNRIIALPAYLGPGFEVAGIKWISSFPGNLELGLDRASAVVILNSTRTGRPEAIIEGSIINAKRTAASAALAARTLSDGKDINSVAMIGCGFINFEIARFLLAALPQIRKLIIYDVDGTQSARFKAKCRESFGELEVEIARDVPGVLGSARLISVATTAINPHIFDLSSCSSSATILHISLRDFSPEVMISCDNVVDDVDHVCRAQTSLHLAEQLVGNRDFIRCTLADITRGVAPARKDADTITVFSPFGLGVLDIAVGSLVRELARKGGKGISIDSFLPGSWLEDKRQATLGPS
jgi:ornithine cyclodeaminase